jgi:HPt (histidine-containing phosphotransfer) domain-containing protein
MIRLGLAGGLGAVGYGKSKQAAKQAEQAAAEQKAIAQPYQAQGQELVRAAQAGELTPTSQQALQATQAKLAQGVEARGGVGAQQAAVQLEGFRQQLLQQQYNYGLQVAQIGDSIAIGAIKTGLQADQQVQQATQNFYTSLAMVAGGLPLAQRS